MAGTRGSESQLLVSRIADRTGLETVATKFGYPSGGPYLYFVLLLTLDLGGLSVVQYVRRGFHPVLAYPLWFIPPMGVFFGVWITHLLTRMYDDLDTSLSDQLRDPEPLGRPLTPIHLQLGTYLVTIAGVVVWLAQPGVLTGFLSIEGLLIYPIKLVFVFAGGYYLIIADVVAVVIGIHVLQPWRLLRSGINLDFADPARTGGLRPVGRLIQRSTQIYFVGLFAYTIVTIAPLIFPSQPGPRPGVYLYAVFVTAWLAGFGLFLLPTVWLHREMRRQKQARLDAIHSELAELGDCDAILPNMPASDDEIPRYLYLQLALDRTERTREYPTDAGLMRDLGISSMPSIVTYTITVVVTVLG